MKHQSSARTLIFVLLMWLLLLLGCASSGTTNSTRTTVKDDRLAPMSANQKADVIAVMNLTDDLDDVGKSRRKTKNAWALYIAKYTKAHDKFNEVYPSLPKNDARMMLYNMMDAYENVGSLMLGQV